MVFPWHVPYANPELTKAAKGKALDMLRDEVRARARVLHRLGYKESDVTARITRYTEWDFETSGKSHIKEEVAKLVKEVFGVKKAP